METDGGVPALALVALLLTAGCVGGLPDAGSQSDEEPTDGWGEDYDRGTIHVFDADQPPKVPPVPHTNETVRSTEPLQTVLDRYRDGESGLLLHVEGEEYHDTRTALQQLAEGTAPARKYGTGPNTYIQLEDDLVRIGLTLNATA